MGFIIVPHSVKSSPLHIAQLSNVISKMTLQFPIFPLEYFQASPAKRFLSLKNSPGILNPAYIDEIFQELRPIKPDNLMGEWDGFILSTGHPFEHELEELNWFGNTFDCTDDVAPLIVAKNGERVQFDEWGSASVSSILVCV